MIGSILGDILGSKYEFNPTKSENYELISEGLKFTDDSVLTLAVGKWMLWLKKEKILINENNSEMLKKKLIELVVKYVIKYPNRGYSGTFISWVKGREHKPYNSYGNGAAMRVSTIGLMGESLEEVLFLSKISSEITHNHLEGIKGSQSVAVCIYLAKTGKSKNFIKEYIEKNFKYDLNRNYNDIKTNYTFNITCQGSVPESIICFLESEDYETTIRNCINMRGDSDTMCCIAGGIAESYYNDISEKLIKMMLKNVSEDIIETIEEIYQ